MAVQDFGMPLGSQSRNTECHGDPVVQKCVDGRPVQGIAAADHHAVGGGDGITAHGFQVVGDSFDAVGFFDLQLCRIPDKGGSLCQRCHDRNDRDLID